MADINFVDNRIEVSRAIEGAIAEFLFEASGELVSQTARNTRVDTGKTKGSWKAEVDEENGSAVIGSNEENAIWEEFGTGIYAQNGDGRKTPWHYKDAEGNWHTTKGKKAQHTFQNAFDSNKNKIIEQAKKVLKVNLKD